MKNDELKELLSLLNQMNVIEYSTESIKIVLKPEHKLEAPKVDLSIPKKTKEQEAEEVLFYSTGR
jgi:glutamyl-tRNA reductase